MKWIVPIVLFAMMVGCTTKQADKNPDGHQQEPVAPLVGGGPHRADHSSNKDAIHAIQTETVHEQKIHL